MAAKLGTTVQSLIGNEAFISKIDTKQFVTEQFGELTIKDILSELKTRSRSPERGNAV